MKFLFGLTFMLLSLSLQSLSPVQAGYISGAACQAGCASMQVPCYAGAGAIFGTVVASASTPAVILACNSGFGKCMSACSGLYATWLLP